MGSTRFSGILVSCLLLIIGLSEAQLQLGFYAKNCPNAEKIVKDYVEEHIHNAPSLAAALLRLHFHDCFVRGCDASVLLNSTSSNQAEKDAAPNLTLRGFDFIDRIKSRLEAQCPGIVSCADVVALAARDSIVATGGPTWKVPTGRRDGVIARSAEAEAKLPSQLFSNLSDILRAFANAGLDLKDLVLLSGAHTIGISHCSSFSNRLYNFTRVDDQDPALDTEYAAKLKAKCKTLTDKTTIVEMDPGSFRTFDRSYYTNLLKRRGLFQSDAALTTNSTTYNYINQLLKGSLQNFYDEFAKSMEKMGRANVKTGSAGEIRKQCSVVNS